jgi:hypothetical protein
MGDVESQPGRHLMDTVGAGELVAQPAQLSGSGEYIIRIFHARRSIRGCVGSADGAARVCRSAVSGAAGGSGRVGAHEGPPRVKMTHAEKKRRQRARERAGQCVLKVIVVEIRA